MAERGPYKLTPLVQKRISDAITAGNYIETAAAYAGISKETLYAWLRKGARRRRGPYHEFAKAVERALADAEVRDVATIGLAASMHWQAAAWRLERKHPDRWGRKFALKHDNPATVDESLTSLITESMADDPAFADVGKGFPSEKEPTEDDDGDGGTGGGEGPGETEGAR